MNISSQGVLILILNWLIFPKKYDGNADKVNFSDDDNDGGDDDNDDNGVDDDISDDGDSGDDGDSDGDTVSCSTHARN